MLALVAALVSVSAFRGSGDPAERLPPSLDWIGPKVEEASGYLRSPRAAIVVGSFESEGVMASEGPYDADEIRRDLGEPNRSLPTVDVTYFDFRISEVIYGQERLPDTATLRLRVPGHKFSDRLMTTHMLVPSDEEPYLAIIEENPDGSFGPTSHWSLLLIGRGGALRYAVHDESAVAFEDVPAGDLAGFRRAVQRSATTTD
ncbi:MAG: hypothetical protein M0R73_02865 [Dehalococcoidia bacterium]|nr:hypothetical protein [Dehalococcoidia bacterium]